MQLVFFRILALYGSAFIMAFFSEFVFLNEVLVIDLIAELHNKPFVAFVNILEIVTFYALFTFPFLLALTYFHVRGIFGLILAGALYGWAAEGVMVPAIYEFIPVSFLWTSVSWHVLVDVLVGWYLIRLTMRRNGWVWNVVAFSMLGVFWAFWATWYWGGEEAEVVNAISPDDFTVFAIISSVVWIIGMILSDRFGRETFTPSKWETGLVAFLITTLTLLTGYSFLPLSLAILPLIALTVLALHKARGKSQGPLVLAQVHNNPPVWWKYLLAMLTPVVAILIYPWLHTTNTAIPTEDIILLMLVFGFGAFVAALGYAFRGANALIEKPH